MQIRGLTISTSTSQRLCSSDFPEVFICYSSSGVNGPVFPGRN